MRYERPSTDDDAGSVDSPSESSYETADTLDERRLYGEPCHEVTSEHDEQMLYGEPQHETPSEDRELPDLELLFARIRADGPARPTVLPDRPDIRTATTTEQ